MDFEKKIKKLIDSAHRNYNLNELLIAEEKANQAYNICIKYNFANQEKTAEVLNYFAVFLFQER